MPGLGDSASPLHTDADDALQQRLADVLDDYVAALERGSAPSTEALIAQYPDLTDLLPQYLEGIDWIYSSIAATAHQGHGADLRATTTLAPEGDALRDEKRCIGDFRMLREIGRGGMGVVYEAVQLSLNRRVALKVLPFAAVLDERHIARFRTEAQAAASLHHTNIVPVYAVGQERGVHYYAMQYIEGRSLAQAIEERKQADKQHAASKQPISPIDTTLFLNGAGSLSTARSIRESDYFRTVARLGVQAAQALDHAHQFGVVHRDVKPSNLIVDSHNKLWVADFGLARVQSEMSVTLPGDIVGTLRYMSPEQASGRGDLVDGRSDVYALGATLYELITLCPAHPSDDRHTLLERINTSDPIAPRKLNDAAPIDLETIVLRAMERNREDRYATAAELAEDLQRFLDGKATLARRPNLLERSARWIARRRRAAAAVGLAMIITTALSIASVAWVSAANQRTKQALAASQENLSQAQAHYAQARQVVDHFGGKVADRLADLPGAESLRRDLLLDTLGYYQQFSNSAAADQRLSTDLAATHFKAAAIAERLGDRGAAVKGYQTAVDNWRGLTRGSATDESKSSLALGLSCLARVLAGGGEFERADRLFAEAIALQRSLADAIPENAARAASLAETLCNSGLARRRAGHNNHAVDLMRQGISLYEQALRLAPDCPQTLRDLAVAQNNLSDTLGSESLDEALAASHAAQAIMRRLAELDPSSPQYLADLAMTHNNLAALEGAAGHWRLAADLYRDAAEQISRLVDSNPFIPRHRRELAMARSNLALALAQIGEGDASSEAFDAAETVLTELAEDFPEESIYMSSLAALWNNRGVVLRGAGLHEAALEAFGQAITRQEAVFSDQEPSPLEVDLLSRQYVNYATALRDLDRPAEADAAEQKRQDLIAVSSQQPDR